jgi:precorrin-3B synthase
MQSTDHLCPGILHAVPAKDGLLMRIRTPGGLISGAQLQAVALASEKFAHPVVDITALANIQLRGIREEDLTSIVGILASTGLMPSAEHDRVRNIATSPLAGLDASELLDTRPLVRSLDQALLNDPVLANLPPKFSFLIDGGGRRFNNDSADLSFTATSAGEAIRLHLTVGRRATGYGVNIERATECMVESARACLEVSAACGIASRGQKIASSPDAFASMMSRISHLLLPCLTPPTTTISQTPIGTLPSSQRHFVHIIPSLPLGRITPSQANIIAGIVVRHGGDLRLAPWRGVVLGSVPADSCEAIRAELQTAGLSSNLNDGYAGLAACAGLNGCSSAHADVRKDASILAQRLSGHTEYRGWTVNLSGCDKQCAMRNGATVDLVATPSGYTLLKNGDFFRSECPPEAAIDLVVSSLWGGARPESES